MIYYMYAHVLGCIHHKKFSSLPSAASTPFLGLRTWTASAPSLAPGLRPRPPPPRPLWPGRRLDVANIYGDIELTI